MRSLLNVERRRRATRGECANAGVLFSVGSARTSRDFHFSLRNPAVAKGQKKSNKEIRKPKAEKPKTPVVAVSSFLTPPTAKKK